MHAIRLLCITLVLVATGCTKATGPYFQEPSSVISDKAFVYFYKLRVVKPWYEDRPPGGSSYVYVKHDRIGELEQGSYFVYYFEPGQYRISDTPKDAYVERAIWLTVEASRSYYIKNDYRGKAGLHLTRNSPYEWYLNPVDEESALQELKNCRLMVLSQ